MCTLERAISRQRTLHSHACCDVSPSRTCNSRHTSLPRVITLALCDLITVLDGLAEVEGCFGASRLVCKSEWDYKLIVKFEDLPSLKGFMENEYKSLWTDDFKERVEALSVDGTVKEQSFVYDDIDE